MNPAAYGSLPASACTPGTQGSFGPDRIAQQIHDAVGRVTQVKVAVGTADAATERVLSYSDNGMLATLKDAEDNLTTFERDGFDRLSKTRFPLPARGSNASSTSDYELLGYDASSNVTSLRNRAGQTIGFAYDNLNRVTAKDLPGTEPDVTYAYDNLGRLTAASQTGNALSFTYDALSRNLTQTGPQGTATSQWDLAGRKTAIIYPAGGTALTVDYSYLVTGEIKEIKQGAIVLASYSHDDLGNRTGVSFANGAAQAYGYDPVSRLTSLTNQLAGTAGDLAKTYGYNPALQMVTETRDNDAYAFAQSNATETGVANGLNQLTQYAGRPLSHDAKGNVTAFGADSYGYSSENLLTAATVGGTPTTLAYDPAMRLYQASSGGTTTRLAYDGLNALAEYDSLGVLQRRWVHDPTSGQPVVWYEGSGTAATNRRYLSADERGSVISVSDSNGAGMGINAYDEYGMPAAGNLGRYGYAGQAWIGPAKLWHLNARAYSPALGRFLQTDPIGYGGDGPNLYAYVLNDPVNAADPTGLFRYVQDASYPSTSGGLGFYRLATQVTTYDLATGAIIGVEIGYADQGGQFALPNGYYKWVPARSLPTAYPADRSIVVSLVKAHWEYSGPASPGVFQPITNPPQNPATNFPEGWRVRIMPPTADYPNGYWKLEKPMSNGGWQAIDPSTMKPGTPGQTHIPLPATPTWLKVLRIGPIGIILYGLGIIDPAPVN